MPCRAQSPSESDFPQNDCIADNVDLSNPGTVAFLNVNLDAYRIVRPFLNIGLDFDTVLAAIVILLAQEHLYVIQHRAVEGAPARQTDVAQ